MQSQVSEGRNGRIVTFRTLDLHPHPSYIRHHLAVATCKLSTLAELGEMAFRDPLVITADGTILDGYARWELARRQGRATLRCLEYELGDDEALHRFVQSRIGAKGLNAFCRICLALDLETTFREKALANQRAGGQNKGSSKLTKAESLDVRSEIARIVGVSAGNVTKVRRLLMRATPEVLEALRAGELRIHRAWRWISASPADQREALWDYQCEKGIKKTIRTVVSRHRSRPLPDAPNLEDLCRRLSAIEPTQRCSVKIVVTAARGRVVTVSKELLNELVSQPALPLSSSNSSSRELQHA